MEERRKGASAFFSNEMPMSASDLIGSDVYGPDDNSIGEIEDIIVAKGTKPSFALISYGGCNFRRLPVFRVEAATGGLITTGWPRTKRTTSKRATNWTSNGSPASTLAGGRFCWSLGFGEASGVTGLNCLYTRSRELPHYGAYIESQ
jgi:hypothetical protein